MRIRKNFWGVLVCVVFLGGIALAQVTTGTILGTVSDSTGAVIPGAAVTIRNVDTGITRSVTTDAAGRYRAPQLGLGSYEITAEAVGFQTAVRTGVTLTVGREAMVDFPLQVGAVAERITVTGEAPMIETTNATVGGLVNEQSMRDLPLLGRSFSDLTLIQPGVVSDIGTGTGVLAGGKRISLSGARPQNSLYLLDGADIMAPYNNVTPSSALGELLGVDTVREFTVIQTNAGAQYGRASGGIVNSVTRSGTNEFHGSVFEFLRNENLNANDWFFNRSAKTRPDFKRNAFGGTVGGPIKKDSTFFFASYEGLRQRTGSTDVFTTLTKEAREGTITDCANPPACNQAKIVQTVTVHPDIKPLLKVIPLSNLSTPFYARNGTTNWVGALKQTGTENYGMARIDQRLSDNDSLFGRFTIDESFLTAPKFAGLALPSGLASNDDGGYRFSAIEYTRILSPTLINSVRVAFNRNRIRQLWDFNPDEFPAAVFITPNSSSPTGFARQAPNVQGAGSWNPGTFISPLRFADNTFIYADTVNWNPGNHAFTIGGTLNRYQMNAEAGTWKFGELRFGNEINFLKGIVQRVVGSKQLGDFDRGWRQTYGAVFVQDDWRVRSGLSLNLGVRWERVTAPVEVNGKMAGLEDFLKDATYTTFTDSLFHLRDPLKGFSPRIGFAWTPFADQKTVLRSAFGVSKEILLEYAYQLGNTYPPWAEKFNFGPQPWPNPIGQAIASGASLSAGEPTISDRNLKYPYVLQWNFGIERQIGETLVAKATYIGTRSLGLTGVTNAMLRVPVKQFDPTIRSERWFTPENAITANPNFAASRSFHSIGDAYYHSLQLQIEQRYKSGVSYNASYTFSKNIDTVGIAITKQAEGGAGTMYTANMFDIRSDKSLSTINVKHNFTVSSSYELPFGSGKRFGASWNRVVDLIAGGWQLNGIFAARTGLPSNITNSFDRARNGNSNEESDRPDLRPGGNNNPVPENWTVDRYYDFSEFLLQPAGFYGNAGRQTLIGPKVVNVTFSTLKGFRVGEGKDLQFRAEFFNLPNHPNFSNPASRLFSSASGSLDSRAGTITSLRTPARQIQLGLKFTF